MKKITSFTIDHTKLNPGIYVSRKDTFENVIFTTIDIRIKAPNIEPIIENAAIHTIEHIGSTLLRNNEVWDRKNSIFWSHGVQNWFLFNSFWKL